MKGINMSLTSAHWGTYHAHVKDGRLTGLSPFTEDADPSEIGKGIVDVIDNESRISGPMIRKSWLELVLEAVLNAAAWTRLCEWDGIKQIRLLQKSWAG